MTSLVVGFGEVGKALFSVLHAVYPNTEWFDPALEHGPFGDKFDILHIAFPFSDSFVDNVKSYQAEYDPKCTIIHSTVPVGISRLCGALNSPVRGIHPKLEEGLKTFPKFIGGEKASEVADYFRRAGIKVILCDKQETTELGKLLDTEYYRACLEFTHRAKMLSDKFSVPFHESYTLFNQTYNTSYQQLGYSEYTRPVLQAIIKPEGEKRIGGHCLLPNQKLLEDCEKK